MTSTLATNGGGRGFGDDRAAGADLIPASQPEYSRSVDNHPNWRPARRDPRPVRFVVAMVVGLVFIAFAVTGIVNYLQQVAHRSQSRPRPEAPIPPDASVPPGYENPETERARAAASKRR